VPLLRGLNSGCLLMAERNPLTETSPLAAPLVAVTRIVLRSPGIVVCGAVMLALMSVLVTVNGLSFKTSRLDLLNPRSEYNQRWLAYLEEFGDRDDAVIVVRSEQPRALTAAIDDLAASLRKQPELFESILARRDFSSLQGKALHYVPEADLVQIERQVHQAAALVPASGQPLDLNSALAQLNERLAHVALESPQARHEVEQRYEQVAGAMLSAFGNGRDAEPTGVVRFPLASEFESQYLLADRGRMGFVLLKLKTDMGEFARGSQSIDQLRKTIVGARERHPDAWIGLTGMPIIEFDEMQASQTDMVWTSLISFVAVAGLFIAGYGGLRHTILANLVLLLAMAWSFGFITLAVGHLNILSSAFAVVLIGIGIDYAIHYIACYLRLLKEGHDPEAALLGMAGEVGPGMVTGGVTTAAAFYMAGMTDFIGVRELGVIAGSGILLCVAATIVVLPPLILLVDRNWPQPRLPDMLPTAGFLNLPLTQPRLTLLVTVVVTLAVGAGAVFVRYDHNLLNLQPRHIESSDIERLVLTKLDDSVWYAVSVCDSPAELQQRKAAFQGLPTVAKTEEIASLLPAQTTARQRVIASIRSAVVSLPAQPPPAARVNAVHLRREVHRAQALLAEQTPYETRATALLAQLQGILRQMPAREVEERVSWMQAALARQSWEQLRPLADISDPQPPQLADLPAELVDRFVGTSRTHLLRVYARGDIWDMDELARFVRDVESVDARVTGHPVQTYYASRHMQWGYIWAGVYALVAVFAFLWLDFRSIRHSLLAMLPLLLGFVQMCGLIGWLGIPFNAANMIALPLILGIGVDDGVHLVHELRRSRGPFRMRNATSVAVLLISTTTTASFGALILARHQGLQSLGQILTLGVTTCLFSSLFFFPALLACLTRNRTEPEPVEFETQGAVPAELVPPGSADEPHLPEPTDIAEQIENEVAALVLASASRSTANDEPSFPPEPLVVPRRRIEPPANESIPVPHGSIAHATKVARETALSHLAGPRESQR
jgi:hopanoid biosynthesis associated RND transporter like protein HpnN